MGLKMENVMIGRALANPGRLSPPTFYFSLIYQGNILFLWDISTWNPRGGVGGGSRRPTWSIFPRSQGDVGPRLQIWLQMQFQRHAERTERRFPSSDLPLSTDMYSSLRPHSIPFRCISVLFIPCRRGDYYMRRLNLLPRIKQLVNKEAGIQTQAA